MGHPTSPNKIASTQHKLPKQDTQRSSGTVLYRHVNCNTTLVLAQEPSDHPERVDEVGVNIQTTFHPVKARHCTHKPLSAGKWHYVDVAINLILDLELVISSK